MKKILFLICVALMVFAVCVLPVMAETVPPATEGEAYGPPLPEATAAITDEPEPTPGEPLTWEYLATIAGATAATLLIVQFLKVPLDTVWKIPTRAFVYVIALVLLLGGTYFTTGLTVNTALLTAVNAVIVALTAYGAYEVTFKKIEKA